MTHMHQPILTHIYFIYYCFKGKVSENYKRYAESRLKGPYFVSATSAEEDPTESSEVKTTEENRTN